MPHLSRIGGARASHCAGPRKLACVPTQASKRASASQLAWTNLVFQEQDAISFHGMLFFIHFRGVFRDPWPISVFGSKKVINRGFARQVNFQFLFRVSGGVVLGQNWRVPFLKSEGVSRVLH